MLDLGPPRRWPQRRLVDARKTIISQTNNLAWTWLQLQHMQRACIHFCFYCILSFIYIIVFNSRKLQCRMCKNLVKQIIPPFMINKSKWLNKAIWPSYANVLWREICYRISATYEFYGQPTLCRWPDSAPEAECNVIKDRSSCFLTVSWEICVNDLRCIKSPKSNSHN